MSSGTLLESLFDKKVLLILKLFINNKGQTFYLREISKSTGVPVATTFRIIKKLMNLEIIKQTKIKKFKIYNLEENEKTHYLVQILKEKKTVIDEFIEAAALVQGITMIIQHGKEEKNKINLLVIGENIDLEKLKGLVVNIKEKQDYTITYLTLTADQFNQMAAMGLYSGNKIILYEK